MAEHFLAFILLRRMHRQLGLHSYPLRSGPISRRASSVTAVSRYPSIDIAPNSVLF